MQDQLNAGLLVVKAFPKTTCKQDPLLANFLLVAVAQLKMNVHWKEALQLSVSGHQAIFFSWHLASAMAVLEKGMLA